MMEENAQRISPNTAAVRMLVSFLFSWLLTLALLFGGAGTLSWTLGWLFAIAWLVPKLVFFVVLRLRHPELLVERATRHENTPQYDRILLPIYFVFAFGALLVGALDGGRFHWSGELSVALIVVAYILYLIGNSIAGWAINANAFFSSESRLQTDRDQVVVKSGPYQYIRHPSYSVSVILWVVTGPMLESWWAVLPGFLAGLMMIIRTVYEDRMLLDELPNYAEYAQQVRYRLFPGIW